MPAGPYALFVAHISGTTLTYTSATRTLADSGDGFVDAGFEVGDTCIMDFDDDTNDPVYLKIESVAVGAIVFVAATGDIADIPTDHAGTATTALHGATPQPVT